MATLDQAEQVINWLLEENAADMATALKVAEELSRLGTVRLTSSDRKESAQ